MPRPVGQRTFGKERPSFRRSVKPARPSILIAAFLCAAGCAHQQQAQEAAPRPAPAKQPAATPAPRAARATAPASCRTDVKCGPKQLCLQGRCVDIHPGLAERATARVHFAFNCADVPAEETATMERIARCLKADRALHVVIEGNVDERGTQKYNLALGQQRAAAVARRLKLLGASPGQLRTVSYGEEMPLCTDQTEECWRKNRRAALKRTFQ